TFTLSVSNSGVSDADGVSLTDTVDGRLLVDSIDPGDYSCGPAGQSISCSLIHLGGGVSKSVTVHYHVASTTNSDPSVSNTGSAVSDEQTTPATGTDTVAI